MTEKNKYINFHELTETQWQHLSRLVDDRFVFHRAVCGMSDEGGWCRFSAKLGARLFLVYFNFYYNGKQVEELSVSPQRITGWARVAPSVYEKVINWINGGCEVNPT